MRLCLACYEDRLASLLENAPVLRLFDLCDNGLASAGDIAMLSGPTSNLPQILRSAHVDELICGGITGCSSRLIQEAGITITSWTTGAVDEVLAAYSAGTLNELSMPGVHCAGPGQGQGPCRTGQNKGQGPCRGRRRNQRGQQPQKPKSTS